MRAAKNKDKLLKVREHLQAMLDYLDLQIGKLQKNINLKESLQGTCNPTELSLIRYQSKRAIVTRQLLAIDKLFYGEPITSTEYELLIKDKLLNQNSLVFRRAIILDHNKKRKTNNNKRSSNDILFLSAKKQQTVK